MVVFPWFKVNTLQNWLTEFNLWLPPQESLSPDTDPSLMVGRSFKVHILNDEHKCVDRPVAQEFFFCLCYQLLSACLFVQNNSGQGQGGGRLVQRWGSFADGLWDVPPAVHEEELRDGQEEKIKEANGACHHWSGWGGPTAGAHERSANYRVICSLINLIDCIAIYWLHSDLLTGGDFSSEAKFQCEKCETKTLLNTTLKEYWRSIVTHWYIIEQ